MTIRFTGRVLAIVAALTAGSAFAQATSGADFVMKAGAGDLYEINSSQVVLETTQDPKIKAFANEMIKHHMKTTAVVTKAAQKAGMTPPPPALDAPKADMVAQLQMASGADRDRLYLQQQGTSHQEALALHTSYAESGDTPALKMAAKKAVPIVKHHIHELEGMSAK